VRVSLTREVSDSDTDASFMTRLAPEISVYTVDPHLRLETSRCLNAPMTRDSSIRWCPPACSASFIDSAARQDITRAANATTRARRPMRPRSRLRVRKPAGWWLRSFECAHRTP
jgi:hypothetical protein